LDNNDMLGLAGYGQVGYGPAEHPNELSWLTENLDTIRDKVSGLQAGQWTIYTNIAQGIDKGVDVLFNSPNGRTAASRVMILLTDGNANQTRPNPTEYNLSQARLDALAAAQDARDLGIRIYTISVGAESDTDLMEQIAEIGAGEWYHAEGSIAAVSAQLNEIFQNVGGRRSVVLIR
ncbi:MAG: VWA domain-containing protein, partial [Phycisphaerae bacterium]|nr:VWA domain-containing protein [Phycisphaerae bacterium]